jgi:hypothetical protein
MRPVALVPALCVGPSLARAQECGCVRVRDRALAWSEWSGPLAFLAADDADPDCESAAPVPGPVPVAPAGCTCAVAPRGDRGPWPALLGLFPAALRRTRG